MPWSRFTRDADQAQGSLTARWRGIRNDGERERVIEGELERVSAHLRERERVCVCEEEREREIQREGERA